MNPVKSRKTPEIRVIDVDRGGNGRHGDGTWTETDGRGCPLCGAIGGGGHGGGCELWKFVYDEDGYIVGRNPPEDLVAAIEHDLRDMRKP